VIVARERLIAGAAMVGALAVGALATTVPVLGISATVILLAVIYAYSFPDQLLRLWLALAAVMLSGYAFIGKGFAYLGRPPLYIGEIALGIGLLALLVRGRASSVMRSPIAAILAAFGLWGAARTVPYMSEYGIEALRDAALWGYGAFSLIVLALLSRAESFARIIKLYWRVFRWLPFCAPVFSLASMLAGDSIPFVPGTQQPIFGFKPGDLAVHLAGAGVFMMLGLSASDRRVGERTRSDWLWWGVWMASIMFAVSFSRGGLLAAVLAFGIVVTLRPHARWWKPALAAVLVSGVLIVFDVSFDFGATRKVSARQLAANVISITDSRQDVSLSGTREWRLAWWTKIIGYTVHGDYFWTGKGFGVNLADDDGFQDGVVSFSPNRSPHSVQMTVLARTGVPGLCLWILLQTAFGLSLVRAYVRTRREGRDWWGRITLWILAYWIALLVNGSFDVYIEGPQGGIWFWCIFGLGLAALRAQREEQTRYRQPIVSSLAPRSAARLDGYGAPSGADLLG
jgi:hypothetical protein